jgi:hypothetical protein
MKTLHRFIKQANEGKRRVIFRNLLTSIALCCMVIPTAYGSPRQPGSGGPYAESSGSSHHNKAPGVGGSGSVHQQKWNGGALYRVNPAKKHK